MSIVDMPFLTTVRRCRWVRHHTLRSLGCQVQHSAPGRPLRVAQSGQGGKDACREERWHIKRDKDDYREDKQ